MSFHLPTPLIIGEESPTVIEKQGIVSILRCDGDRAKAASLRRTLSADMSSKKWLAQNGFSPIKKIASSEHLPLSAVDSFSSSSDGEDEKDGVKRQSQADVWSSILSQQKAEEDTSPPYIHPLVKRSNSLTGKSLEVCTESLGSETGSDVFSSYSSSESGDENEEKEEVVVLPQQQAFYSDKEETLVVKNKYSTSKKVQPRSFPPPLPSLARSDGPSLHMHSHRQNGRLVLEAVSVPSNNFFHAQRQDGRLLLTLLNTTSEDSSDEAKVDQEEGKLAEYEVVFDIFDEKESEFEEEGDDDEEEKEEEIGEVEMEKGTKTMSSRVINVHRSALSMKKFMGVENLNPSWPHKFNKGVKLMEVEEEEEEEEEMVVVEQQQTTPLPQSLPPFGRLLPPPTGAAAASFNAYEYFWRAKPAAGLGKPPTHQNPPLKTNNKVIMPTKCPKVYEQQDQMVLLRANKELVPSLRGCKEPRRSLLLCEPYCIATS